MSFFLELLVSMFSFVKGKIEKILSILSSKSDEKRNYSENIEDECSQLLEYKIYNLYLNKESMGPDGNKACPINDRIEEYNYAIKIIQNNFSAAVSFLESAADKGLIEAKILVAQIMEFEAKFKEADKIFNEIKYQNSLCSYHYGRVMELNGEKEEALKFYKIAGDEFNYKRLLCEKLDNVDDNLRNQKNLILFGKNEEFNGNAKDAKIYYKIASDMGNIEACFLLGKLMFNNKEYQSSFSCFKKCFEHNDVEAMVYIGKQLECGYGMKKDVNSAALIYRKAALQGSAKAQVSYGKMIEFQKILCNDIYTTAKKYIHAVETKNEVDIFYYEMLMEFGDENRLTSIEPALEYKKAYQREDFAASRKYKSMLFKGEMKESTLKLVCKYYELSANQKDPEGLFYYGMMYEFGDYVHQNFEKAVECYKESSNMGHDGGRFNLLRLIKYGDGIEQNLQQYNELIQNEFDFSAFKPICNFYKKNALNEKPWAYCRYGMLLENGIILKQDTQKAALYYKFAADQGIPIGFIYIGHAFEYGIGVSKNIQNAENYYKNVNYHKISQKKGLLYNVYELIKKYSE